MRKGAVACCAIFLAHACAAWAGSPSHIAIILDDLGEQGAAGWRAVKLPGPVALAFLPNTVHGAAQAEMAHARGKEVLLHLPLQPGSAARPYPTAITAAALRSDVGTAFATALASIPHVSGVNNHQGSLLTELPEHMGWLMAEIKARPELYFVDSRTSASSIAYKVARAYGVPAAERSVFLDDARGEDAVRAAFRELVALARRDERALAIAHPYPETFRVLETELPQLARHGVELIAPSELIARQSAQPVPQRLKLSPVLTLATRTTVRALPAATSVLAR